MNVDVTTKSPVEKLMTIEVEPERYEKILEKVIKDVSKEVQIPGFRMGKAPKAAVIRKVGLKNLKKELLDDLAPDVIFEALKEKDVTPLTLPMIENYENIEFEIGKPIKFEVSFEVKPDFDVEGYKGLELIRVNEVINVDEIVEKQIVAMQEKAGVMVPIEEERELREGDVAHLDFESFKQDGTQVAGGKAMDYYMTMEKDSFIPGFMNYVIGKRAGEKWEFDIEFPETYPEKGLAGELVKFKMQLHGIMKKELPERNEDFAKSSGNFQTFEEMKADVENRIKESIENNQRYSFQEQAISKLVEKHKDLTVPTSLRRAHQERFIENLARSLDSQGITLEQHLQEIKSTAEELMEQMIPQADNAARAELIIDKISQVEEIKVTDEDVNEDVAKVAKRLNQDPDVVRKAMERDRYIGMLRYEVMNRKVFDVIINSANVTEKTFKELEEERQAKLKELQERLEKINTIPANDAESEKKEEEKPIEAAMET
jgi:trigger factor